MKKTALTFVCVLFLFSSCNKNKLSPPQEIKNNPFVLSVQEQEELNSLKKDLKEVNQVQYDKASNGISPHSADNYMDLYGLNFEQALLEANELNQVQDMALSFEAGVEKWKADLSVPYQQGLTNHPFQLDADFSFSLYAESLHTLYMDNFESATNRNYMLAMSKVVERLVLKSKLLHAKEKDVLLLEIALLKYMVSSMHDHGMTINGTDYTDQIRTMTTNGCIRNHLHQIASQVGTAAALVYWMSFAGDIILACQIYVLTHG